MGTVTIPVSGGNDYDIYGTQAAATIYLAAQIGASAWASASVDTQAQGLVTATRLIRNYLAGLGYDVDPAEVADTEIQEATYEFAYALVVDSTVQDALNQSSNTRRVKAGSAEVEYFRPERGGRFPTKVQALLNEWISGQGGGGLTLGAAYGTCETSTIDGDDYGLNEGY